MIFARESDAALASLVKEVDALVAKHSDKKLKAFVNILGEDRDTLEADAKKFAADHKIANVPVVVPVEFTNGPDNFAIDPKAEVTVMLYSGMKVKANYAFAKGKLDKKAIATVTGDLPKILE